MSETEHDLREKIEEQRLMIVMALGYIRSGKPEIAALVLENTAAAPKASEEETP